MRWLVIIGAALCTLSSCSATCLRDSDCIGASVCLRDRCVLLGARELSEAGTPTAGSGAATSVGGATPARDILDAASDATLAPAAR
jgi:hypothetical protein